MSYRMNPVETVLVKLLASSLRNIPCDLEDDFVSDWDEVYKEARAHQIHTLIFPAVSKLQGPNAPSQEKLDEWKRFSLIAGMKMFSNYQWMANVLKAFYEKEIPVMVLKGIILNDLYPNPELRLMGDVDIFTREEDIEKASQVLISLGYTPEPDKDLKHIGYSHPQFLSIELHRRLVDNGFLKGKKNFEQLVWQNAIKIDYLGQPVLSMDWNVKVVYLCLHMASHMLDEGFGLKQLSDLVILMERKKDELEWAHILEISQKYGLDHFLFALLVVIHRLFGTALPKEFEEKYTIEEAYIDGFIGDILMSGSFGKKDRERRSANRILSNASDENNKIYQNKFLQMLSILFPSYQKLSARYKYTYIKKLPFLLPVAWVQRIFNSILRRDLTWKDKLSIFKNRHLLKIAEERDDLFRHLRLR